VNAGHNTQFILRGNGLNAWHQLTRSGCRPDEGTRSGRSIERGDLLFFTTDGMIEVEGETEMFDRTAPSVLQRAVGADVDESVVG
jgi:serine phosphatase RsbU (regulator of sigma subunit)